MLKGILKYFLSPSCIEIGDVLIPQNTSINWCRFGYTVFIVSHWLSSSLCHKTLVQFFFNRCWSRWISSIFNRSTVTAAKFRTNSVTLKKKTNWRKHLEKLESLPCLFHIQNCSNSRNHFIQYFYGNTEAVSGKQSSYRSKCAPRTIPGPQ